MPTVSVSACLWVCRVRVVPELLAPTGELSLKWHTFIHSTWGQLTGELSRTLPWCCSVYYELLFLSFWDQFDVGAKWQHKFFLSKLKKAHCIWKRKQLCFSKEAIKSNQSSINSELKICCRKVTDYFNLPVFSFALCLVLHVFQSSQKEEIIKSTGWSSEPSLIPPSPSGDWCVQVESPSLDSHTLHGFALYYACFCTNRQGCGGSLINVSTWNEVLETPLWFIKKGCNRKARSTKFKRYSWYNTLVLQVWPRWTSVVYLYLFFIHSVPDFLLWEVWQRRKGLSLDWNKPAELPWLLVISTICWFLPTILFFYPCPYVWLFLPFYAWWVWCL